MGANLEDANLKISSSPHVRSKDTTSDIMFDVLLALVPATVVGLYNFGVHAAILVAVCMLSCVGFEALFQWCMKKKVTVLDFSAAVTGLLLALNLPPELPIWMAVVGSAFAIIVVKQLFGGLGQNFMNPALAARCFLLLSFSKQMTVFVFDGVTCATPLNVLKQGGSVNIKDMFLGFTGGTIGETSTVALLIGAVYLLCRRVISPRIPLVYIGTFSAAIAIYGAATGKSVGEFLLAHLCGGGLMLGAWFMATDYVTSPITAKGKIVFGVILGLLTFVLRIYGSGAEGVSYAIIISNLLVPLIEKVTVPKMFGQGAELKDKYGNVKPVEKTEAKAEAAEDDKSYEASEEVKEKMDGKGIARAIAAIFAITLVMGAALGVVYNVTKDPIADANEKAKQEAYKEVFPDAVTVKAVEYVAEDVTVDVLNEVYMPKMGYDNDTIDEVCIAKDADGNDIGLIITVTNSNGYGGDITMVVGIAMSKEVDGVLIPRQLTGISFLNINETVGLGMQATEKAFKEQFVGELQNHYEYTKTGKTEDNQIDALSGATITTSAVVEGINAAISLVTGGAN